LNPDKLIKILLIAISVTAILTTGMILVAWQLTAADRAQRQAALQTSRASKAGLPVFFDVPPFSLTDAYGSEVTNETMLGRVWVAQFFFSQCKGICPMTTARMKDVYDRVAGWESADQVVLLSFSVDPANDTPEVLQKYAVQAGADPQRWRFITGEKQALWSLSIDGFKLPVADAPENDVMPIIHSQKMALVDREGRIRGYYDPLAPDGRTELLLDLLKLSRGPVEVAPGPSMTYPGTPPTPVNPP